MDGGVLPQFRTDGLDVVAFAQNFGETVHCVLCLHGSERAYEVVAHIGEFRAFHVAVGLEDGRRQYQQRLHKVRPLVMLGVYPDFGGKETVYQRAEEPAEKPSPKTSYNDADDKSDPLEHSAGGLDDFSVKVEMVGFFNEDAVEAADF